MVFIRIWGRPLGAEPKFFATKEEATVDCSCDTGCSPWCSPEVVEFNNEFEARKYIKENYPTTYEERFKWSS